MQFLRAVRRLVGRSDGASEARPALRLNEGEALRLASVAAGKFLTGTPLVLNGIEDEGGRIVWRFWTPTIGRQVWATVDDLTSEAHAGSHGLR